MKRTAFAVFVLLFLLSVLSPAAAVFAEDNENGSEPKTVIVIDPGHGGSTDTGAAVGDGVERTYTLKYAKLLSAEIEKYDGFAVYLTRTEDKAMSHVERVLFANSVNADLFLSVHFDGSDDLSASGVTAYCSVVEKFAAVHLGNTITEAVAAAAGMNDNGVIQYHDDAGYYWNDEKQWDVKDDSFPTLSDYYGIPTWCAKFGIIPLIVEHGYASNKNDLSVITSDEGLLKMAKAEAAVVVESYTNHKHIYGEKSPDFPSNCVFCGKESEKCEICKKKRNTALLPAAPDSHYWIAKKADTTEASCAGELQYSCLIADNLIDRGYEVKPHTKTESTGTVHKFEKTGDTDHTCSVCGFVKNVCPECGDASEPSTLVITKQKPATCTLDGMTEVKCGKCGFFETLTQEKTGHSFIPTYEWPATCSDTGTLMLSCKHCGASDKRITEKTAHDYVVIEEKESGFFSGGYSIVCCKLCEKTERNETASFMVRCGFFILGGVIFAGAGTFAVFTILKKKKSEKAYPDLGREDENNK